MDPKELRSLQKVWNKKLEKSGFVDIEKPNGDLIQPASEPFRYRPEHSGGFSKALPASKVMYDGIKQQYFEIAQDFLNDYKFETRLERVIWTMHVDGMTIRDISAKCKSGRWKAVSKSHVGRRILALSVIMLTTFQMSNDDMIVVRDAIEEDVAFIFATALRNIWYSAALETTLPKDKWMKLKHFELEKNLDLYPTVVAVLNSDPLIILGYAINTPEPYVYIKKAWREAGVEDLLRKELSKINHKEVIQ